MTSPSSRAALAVALIAAIAGGGCGEPAIEDILHELGDRHHPPPTSGPTVTLQIRPDPSAAFWLRPAVEVC
jgi:hypothetical protein